MLREPGQQLLAARRAGGHLCCWCGTSCSQRLAELQAQSSRRGAVTQPPPRTGIGGSLLGRRGTQGDCVPSFKLLLRTGLRWGTPLGRVFQVALCLRCACFLLRQRGLPVVPARGKSCRVLGCQSGIDLLSSLNASPLPASPRRSVPVPLSPPPSLTLVPRHVFPCAVLSRSSACAGDLLPCLMAVSRARRQRGWGAELGSPGDLSAQRQQSLSAGLASFMNLSK